MYMVNIFYHIYPNLITLRKRAFENDMGKGENTGDIFPQRFVLNSDKSFQFSQTEAISCKCFQFGPVWNFFVL